jgi:hypothetical protein
MIGLVGSIPSSPLTSAGIVCGLTKILIGQYNNEIKHFLKKDMNYDVPFNIFTRLYMTISVRDIYQGL